MSVLKNIRSALLDDVTLPNNPYHCLIEDPDLPYLFKFVNSRFLLKKQNKRLDENDSSVYYKLRHNVFKNYVCFITGLPNLQERPFTEFKVDSNRTPDLLMEKDEYYVLVEYTVTNQIATAVDVKQSMSKYDPELIIMRQSKEVKDYYLLFGLDQDVSLLSEQIKGLCSELDLVLTQDPFTLLDELRESFQFLQWHISSLMPELLLHSNRVFELPYSKILDVAPPFKIETRLVGVKRNRSSFIRNLLMKQTKILLAMARRKSHSLKYTIVLNFKDNVAFLSMDKEGLTKNELTSLLQSGDDRIFDYCQMKGTFEDVEEPFSAYGDVEISGDYERLSSTEIHFDTHNYVNRVFVKLNNSNVETLSDCNLEEMNLKVEKVYREKIIEKNQHNKIIIKKKNPFIFPMSIGLKNLNSEDNVNFKSGLFLTNKILRMSKKISNVKKVVSRTINYDALVEVEKNLTTLGKKLRNLGVNMRDASSYKIKPNELSSDPEAIKIINDWRECKKAFKAEIVEETRLSYGNRITIPMSEYKKNWPLEIEHFSKDSSLIETFESDNEDGVLNLYKSALENIFLTSNIKSTDLIFGDTNPVGLNLKSLCDQMSSELKVEEDKFLHTNLANNLLMISRFCYSLSYYSNIKLNKNDFCYDNLGYSNVRLIVRGGKKIVSSRRSRMFKLVFPVNMNILEICQSDSCESFFEDGQWYLITPWRQFKQDFLKKGIELYHNFSNYYISSKFESRLNEQDFNKFVSLKVLNLFSQKRKIEVWFSSLRYIYFNSLGTHSNVLELIPDMVEYDYDSYMFLIQRLFCKNYKNVFQNMKNNLIYDIFNDIVYENFDLCAEKFEENLFMTKAPFDSDNEHLKNLKSVLSTQKSFMDVYNTFDSRAILEKTSVDCSSDNYVEDLFSDDFKIDPKMCFLIGKHCEEVMSSSLNKSDLNEKFYNIMSESFTKIQTSKGMRSSEGKFWGDKGFEVVYKNNDLISEVKELLDNFPTTDKAFDKYCSSKHRSFLDTMTKMADWEMEFDMKDKVQYKGSREIYVMTDKTKIMQQPLEKMFKILCSHLPNEIIHKKSHERPKFIHSKIFEYSKIQDELTYCTLDCRKWAPRSNLWKYVYFILGMQNILPDNFVVYFLMVWEKMFKKKIRFQKRYCEIIKNNKNTEDLFKMLDERKDGDFEMVVPYSFMMGIFNYLSSLFHAASQLYFDKEIASKLGSNLRLMAHSDDSGGVIISKSYERNIKTFKFYEIFQKTCNHLMSKKKSVLSHNSFELISIMYNNKKLIPMTHKFLTNLAYDPKGTGWQEDISTVVSKVVDLFSNGGTLRQCYSMMLAQGELLRKIYHLPRSKRLSEIPLAFGGLFNMHPLHLIMLGAPAQEVMLDLVETKRARSFRINVFNLFSGGYTIGRGSQINYTLPYFILQDKRIDFDQDQEDVLSGLSKYQKYDTLMDVVRYLQSLKLQKFRYSLEGIDTFKILFSSLFFQHKAVKIDTNLGIPLTDLAHMYLTQGVLGLHERNVELDFSNEYNYLRASESLKFDYKNFNLEMDKTCKPINYNTFMNLGLNLSFEKVSNILAYNSNEKVKAIMSNGKKWEIMTDWLLNALPGEHDDKLKQLSVLERKDVEKRRSAYLFMPSGTNVDTVERFWTHTLLYCTKRYQIFKGHPQFYTMESFDLWNTNFESLKHHYLCLKILLQSKPEKMKEVYKKLIDNINNCQTCVFKNPLIKSMSQIISLFNIDYFDKINIDVPFATYETPQRRGRMVWYGNSDFTLYTRFGMVKHQNLDGVIKTNWYIDDEDVLEELWAMYKVFCETRGIYIPEPQYGYTGELSLRLSFNDLRKPYVSSLRTFSLILENSTIYKTQIVPFEVVRYEDGFYHHNKKIDLNIYYVYDINSTFYNDHGLKDIKDLILPKNCSVNKELLLNHAKSSKIFKVLSLDDHHKTRLNVNDKYKNEGLLGSQGSLTRALCIADHKGILRYKSSINIKPLEIGAFESQTIKDVPVLHLMKSISYIRYTYLESQILIKIANEESLNSNDVSILEQMISKTGLESTGASVVNFKYIYRTLTIGDIKKTPNNLVLDFYSKIIDSIHDTMAEFPKTTSTWQYSFDRKSWWTALKSLKLIKTNKTNFAYLISSALLRCQYDDPIKFWNIRRENPLFASMNLHKFVISNMIYFFSGLFSRLVGDVKSEVTEIHSKKRHFLLAKEQTIKNIGLPQNKTLKSEINDEVYFSFMLDKSDEETLEENLDNMVGCDDIDDYLPRVYKPYDYENQSDEETKGDSDEDSDDSSDIFNNEFYKNVSNLKFTVNTNKDLLLLQEFTAQNSFETIEIYCKYRYITFKWLGAVDKGDKTINGIKHYCSYYPGKGPALPNLHFREIYDPVSISYEDIKNKIEKGDEMKAPEINSPEYFLEDYLRDTLESDNLRIKPFLQRFIGRKDLNLEEILEKINLEEEVIKQKRIRKTNKNYLPGFSGILDSPEIHAELKSLFGENYHFVISGQSKISVQTYRFLLRNCKDLFFKASENHKALMVIIMSIMKDSIVGNESDAWFVDSITTILDNIENQYDAIEDNTVAIAPDPDNEEFSYSSRYEFDEI